MRLSKLQLVLLAGLIMLIPSGWWIVNQREPSSRVQTQNAMKNLTLAVVNDPQLESGSIEADHQAHFNDLNEEQDHLILIKKLNAHTGDPTPILSKLWEIAEQTEKKSYRWIHTEDESILHPYLLLLKFCESHPQQVATHLQGILHSQKLLDADPTTESSSDQEILAGHLIQGMNSKLEPTANLCMALLPSVGEFAIPAIPDIEEAFHHRAVCTSYPSYHARNGLFENLPDESILKLSRKERLEFRGFAAAAMIKREIELDRAFQIAGNVIQSNNSNSKETILSEIHFSGGQFKAYQNQIDILVTRALTDPSRAVRRRSYWLWRLRNMELPPDVFIFYEHMLESDSPFEREQSLIIMLNNPEWNEKQKSELINRKLSDQNRRIRENLLNYLTSTFVPPDRCLQSFREAYEKQNEHLQDMYKEQVVSANWPEEAKKKVLAVMQ